MNKPSPLIWLAILFFLLLPPAAGKYLLDFAGGIILLILITPIILGGVGWIGWRIFKSKLRTCENCNANFLNSMQVCPICGEQANDFNIDTQPASSVVIDITPKNKS